MTCEAGMVHEDVAEVELHFPRRSMVAVDVVPAPEIGDAYYLTCWEGEREPSALVLLDEYGRELERTDYLPR